MSASVVAVAVVMLLVGALLALLHATASTTSEVMASCAGTWASWRSAVNTGVRIANPTTTPTWRRVYPGWSKRCAPAHWPPAPPPANF